MFTSIKLNKHLPHPSHTLVPNSDFSTLRTARLKVFDPAAATNKLVAKNTPVAETPARVPRVFARGGRRSAPCSATGQRPDPGVWGSRSLAEQRGERRAARYSARREEGYGVEGHRCHKRSYRMWFSGRVCSVRIS